jgi:hypothetical protein
MPFEFFSEHDLGKDGKPRAERPSWYNPANIRDMENKVNEMEVALRNGWVPRGHEPEYRDNLAQLKDQLKAVQDMTNIDDSDNDPDEIYKACKEAGITLKEHMPSRYEMEKGLADAQMEYEYMTTPSIDVSQSKGIQALFEGCHMDIPKNGRVTREAIAKVYQIGMKKIGENPDLEYLRKENMTASAGRRRR